ncbi:MAG: hypothetical protein JWM27_865 [Gemmatimonadetes bacterium]|nr:hypothetical protein [Gemmatimonadota bacterium]
MHPRALLAVATALLATAAVSSRAGAQRGGHNNLPQVACTGGAPQATREALAAQAALDRTILPTLSEADRQRFYTTALQQADAGIAANAGNAYHQFLAGRAHAGLGQLTEANAAWDRALAACPELRDEVATRRREALDLAFNAALQKYTAGDVAGAVSGWETVVALDSTRAEALFNLGVAYTQQNDQPRAVTAFRRVLAQPVAAGDTTAAERRGGAMTGLASAGTAYFQQNKFAEAHDIFASLHRADPTNRDAVYNDALALYKSSRWTDEVPVATRMVQIEPLNYNAHIILFNAYKGLSEEARTRHDSTTERTNRNLALHTLEAADALPVQLDGIQIGASALSGTVQGAKAAAGTPVNVEFTLYGADGRIGTETAHIPAPAKDAKAPFSVPLTNAAAHPTSFSYRVLP